MNKRDLEMAVFAVASIAILLMSLVAATAPRADSQTPIRHLFVTGQSLANGGQGAPSLDPVNPCPGALHWDGSEWVPKEGRATLHIPSVSMVHKLCAAGGQWASNTSAKGGANYELIKQGTSTYSKLVAAAQPGTIPAVVLIHGSADRQDIGYAAHVAELRADLETDLNAATGHAGPVPLFLTQMSRTDQVYPVHGQQVAAHDASPLVHLVGPAYQYPHADAVHLNNVGYYRMGEQIADVVGRVLGGGSWEPLRPVSLEGSGSTVDVRYSVPVGPVRVDGPEGFEVSGGTVTGAVAVSVDTVRLSLSVPAAGRTVSYPKGSVRDSSPLVSELDGHPLPNYSIAFEAVVGGEVDESDQDPNPSAWSTVFDGTAAGLPSGADIDGVDFHDGDVYVSLSNASVTIPGFGPVFDEDVITWDGQGWRMVFDGSVHGLTSSGEDVDGFAVLPDGSLWFSTVGAVSAGGVSGPDEDVFSTGPGVVFLS